MNIDNIKQYKNLNIAADSTVAMLYITMVRNMSSTSWNNQKHPFRNSK